MSTKHKLILIDDHKMFLEGIASILKNEDKYTIELATTDGKNILKYLTINPDCNVDLVIMDISMPGMDGIALNRELKTNFPKIKTLVISSYCEIVMIEKLINDQVDGYILKEESANNYLFTAIDTILSGKPYFSEKVKKIRDDERIKNYKRILSTLSEKEKQILILIAKEYTTQEMVDVLGNSKSTIDSYRKTLLSILGARNSAGLAIWAVKLGLLEPE